MAATDEAVVSMIEGEVFGTRPIDELLALVDSTPEPVSLDPDLLLADLRARLADWRALLRADTPAPVDC
jgi:hypothetical protein